MPFALHGKRQARDVKIDLVNQREVLMTFGALVLIDADGVESSEFAMYLCDEVTKIASTTKTFLQRSLSDVIRRLDAFVAQEGKEPFKILHQCQGEIRDVFVFVSRI